VLEASHETILERLTESAVVLDVGGGVQPFERADWVIDLLPYEERASHQHSRPLERERFTRDTWVTRDICAPEPWPFADKEFDFVICSHTLEDVRDPIRVCQEMTRVGNAGYIEVPSRLEEQSYGFHGPWTGWSHHRWLVDIEGANVQFVFKHAVLHGRRQTQFDAAFRFGLSPRDRVQFLFWEGSFGYRERILLDAQELDAYLAEFVAANGPPPGSLSDRALARARWLRSRPRRALELLRSRSEQAGS